MSCNRENAIEKVRKLRALAERPGTEHEGKAARASAARPSHERYQYNVTVWVDAMGNVTPESQPTYVD